MRPERITETQQTRFLGFFVEKDLGERDEGKQVEHFSNQLKKLAR